MHKSTPLWTTRDGGAHWRRSRFHGVVAFTLDSHYALALTGRCQLQHCVRLGLHRFSVATGRWRALRLPDTSLGPTVRMTMSGSSVWIEATGAASAASHLWSSKDRGVHFVARSSPCSADQSATGLFAESASTLWAVCTGATTTVRRSTNAGIAWSPVAVPGTLTSTAAVAPASPSSAIVATGTGTQLFRTTDGGSTFTDVTPGAANGRWALVRLSTAQTGAALLVVPGQSSATGRDVELWRSTNAGATWTGPVKIAS